MRNILAVLAIAVLAACQSKTDTPVSVLPDMDQVTITECPATPLSGRMSVLNGDLPVMPVSIFDRIDMKSPGDTGWGNGEITLRGQISQQRETAGRRLRRLELTDMVTGSGHGDLTMPATYELRFKDQNRVIGRVVLPVDGDHAGMEMIVGPILNDWMLPAKMDNGSGQSYSQASAKMRVGSSKLDTQVHSRVEGTSVYRGRLVLVVRHAYHIEGKGGQKGFFGTGFGYSCIDQVTSVPLYSFDQRHYTLVIEGKASEIKQRFEMAVEVPLTTAS